MAIFILILILAALAEFLFQSGPHGGNRGRDLGGCSGDLYTVVIILYIYDIILIY